MCMLCCNSDDMVTCVAKEMHSSWHVNWMWGSPIHPYEHAFTHEAKLPQMTAFKYRSNIHEIILFYLIT